MHRNPGMHQQRQEDSEVVNMDVNYLYLYLQRQFPCKEETHAKCLIDVKDKRNFCVLVKKLQSNLIRILNRMFSISVYTNPDNYLNRCDLHCK